MLAAASRLEGLATNTFDNTVGLTVDFEPKFTQFQHNTASNGLFSGRQTGDRAVLARNFLLANADAMGLTTADIEAATLSHRATDPTSGLTFTNFQQMLNGLPIANTNAEVNFTKFGEVITAGGNFVPGLEQANIPAPNLSGMIHPTLALRAVTDKYNLTYPQQLEGFTFLGGQDLKFVARSSSLSQGDIPINAQYLATENGVKLAWNFNLQIPGSADWYNISVDAQNGKLIRSINMTSYFAGHDEWEQAIANRPATRPQIDAGQGPAIDYGSVEGAADENYNVYPIPKESPYDGPRQVVTNPHLAGGTNPATDPSPYGWLDTNAVIGAESTQTVGNNVDAHEDRDANNTGGIRADGGATLNFDFPIDFTLEPTTPDYQKAAITNLFYYNNVLHDIHYKYGFTEQFFNFQNNQYGRNGTASAGNDAVQADAQDGTGFNNANFATPANGSAGRMQMYLWNAPTPDRDGDIDNGIIAHEYGHGVSNRLITNGTGQMSSNQSRGMGEGWSDFYALMFQQTASDTINGRHPIGTYALNQDPNTGAGIRVHPYSYNTTINPITWGYYGSGTYQSPYNPGVNVTRSTAVHFGGTIWNSTLWDMNWLLINKHGYDSNLYTGYNAAGTTAEKAGNKLALRLVMDAMKILVPTNPSFTESRDAIIAADQALTGGANFREIWTAFARRGLGLNVAPQTATSTATITANYDTPIFTNDPYISAATPNGAQANLPISTLSFTFGEPMNTSSFAVADDVLSFTGPGGVDLASSITGFTWTNSNTLQLTVATQRANGAYQLVLAPSVLAADNGNPMDQDLDQIPGEAIDDRYILNITKSGAAGPVINAVTPNSTPSFSPLSQADFTFSEAINQASFSVADDIVSFTGPGGVNLKPQISGFSFLNATTLRVNMTTQVRAGAYTMQLGPNVSASLDGAVMDQDADGNAGEPAQDVYSATFNITRSFGPDSFGYQAAEYPLQNATLLTAGAAGVVSIVNNQDDGTAANIPLGTNVFRYYTTNYTGATSLFITPNGNISFTTANTGAGNTDLGATPTNAVIAPLWDDWVSNVDANDQALYKFVDADNNGSAEQLVIQWDVHRFQATGNPVKFQLIMELNTGADPGRMIFNYFDLDAGVGNVGTNGASSTVGIKDTGAQSTTLPSRRIVASQNSGTFPWVQTGKAIVIDTDVTPPEVATSSYAFETAQSASFAFTEDVANFGAAKVSVTNLTTASSLTPDSVTYNSGSTSGAVNLPTTLADGNYRIVIDGANDGSGVRDAAGNPLDGDISGVAGGNHTFEFFFLRGDANRDRSVNIGDFSILAAGFNTAGTFSDGDFNYDGQVNISDFSILASKFNTSLPAALARTPVGSSSTTTPALAAATTRSPFNSTTPVWSTIEAVEETLPV